MKQMITQLERIESRPKL